MMDFFELMAQEPDCTWFMTDVPGLAVAVPHRLRVEVTLNNGVFMRECTPQMLAHLIEEGVVSVPVPLVGPDANGDPLSVVVMGLLPKGGRT